MSWLSEDWTRMLQATRSPNLASDLIRRSLINGISKIMLLLIGFFLSLFLYFDVKNWYHLLPAFPLYVSVLVLQRKQFAGVSRSLFFWGSYSLLIVWSLLNRRSGAEYGLIALGFASAFMFDKKIILYFLASATAFLVYKIYDNHNVFVPVEGYDYAIFPNMILAASGLVILLEIAFYRNLSDFFYSEITNQRLLLQQAILVKQRAEAATQDANEKLKASNEELKTLTEQLDWIIKQKTSELESYLNAINVNIYSAVTDTKGTIVKINKPFMHATGYSEQELLGKNLRIVKSGHHSETLFTKMYTTIQSGETWRGEIKNKSKNGNSFWIDMVILPLKNEKDELTYFLTLALPITERKELEEKREKAVQMLESVTFRTSHNIRGPLARILGLVSLIKNEMVTEEECRTVAGMLIKSSSELDQSTRDLVSFVNEQENYFAEKLKE